MYHTVRVANQLVRQLRSLDVVYAGEACVEYNSLDMI